MTAASTSSTRSEPRLLVIGDDEIFLQVAAQTDQPPIRAADHFEAIGELAMRGGSDRITTVLIDETSLDPDGSALHAIRSIDPTIDLIALRRVSGNGAAGHVAANLFDGLMRLPLTADALQRALADVAETDSGTGSVASPLRTHAAAAATPPTSERDATATAPPISEISARPVDSLPDQDDSSLGDVDLIDALLVDPRGLRERALSIIRQYAGLADLSLEQKPPHPRCAEVCAAGTTYGWLTAAEADPEELASWADWLSRWLSLERQFRTYRRLAYRDDLTGAWNRRFFFRFLDETLRDAQKKRRPVTLMVFDIDDFKLYNDQFGHHAGDEVLIETVRLLQSVIRTCDRVCRIGGDEFAVIFADIEGPREVGSAHPETVEQIARRFQDQVCKMRFPKLGEQAPGPLSISGGLAAYPWDGVDANALLRHADQLALESKRRGKNVITFGPGLQRSHS